MEKETYDAMLAQVASAYHTTPENIRRKIAQALEEDALEMIPHAGPAPTVEDFVEYLARTLEQPYVP